MEFEIFILSLSSNLIKYKIITFLSYIENLTLLQIIQCVAASSGIHAGASSVATFLEPE